MPKTRVLIAYRLGMMRELLNELVAQEDLESVGTVDQMEEIGEAVRRSCADCLIISNETLLQQPRLCDELLPLHPQLSILVLSPERNFGMLYRNSANGPSGPIECSEQGILNALRAGVLAS